MRTLARMSGIAGVVVAGISGVGAQEAQPVGVGAERPPLQVRMMQSSRGDLSFELSDSAYVGVFEIYPGRGVELLYPDADNTRSVASGYANIHPLGLSLGDEERAIAFAGQPYTGFPPCFYVVASRTPLHLDQYATHPLALASALHYRVPTIGNPQVVLSSVLHQSLPADDRDWASDGYCESGTGYGTSYAYSGFDEYFFPQAGLGFQSYLPTLVLPPTIVTVSACIVRGGREACEAPHVPVHEPPLKPLVGVPGNGHLLAERHTPVVRSGVLGENTPIRGRADLAFHPVEVGTHGEAILRPGPVPQSETHPTTTAYAGSGSSGRQTSGASPRSSGSSSSGTRTSSSNTSSPSSGSASSGSSGGSSSYGGSSYGGGSSYSSGSSHGGASSYGGGGSYGGGAHGKP